MKLTQAQLGLLVGVLGRSILGASYYTKDNLIRMLIERLVRVEAHVANSPQDYNDEVSFVGKGMIGDKSEGSGKNDMGDKGEDIVSGRSKDDEKGKGKNDKVSHFKAYKSRMKQWMPGIHVDSDLDRDDDEEPDDKDSNKGKSKSEDKGSGKNDKGDMGDKSKDKEGSDKNDKVKDKGKNLFFLIAGIPGSGKSTCLAKAMDNYPNMEYVKEPIKHVKFQYMGKHFIHMGSLRSDYPGTDSLPRNHQPLKEVMMDMPMEQIIVGEGQRMTSANLLTALSDHYESFIIHLVCDKNIAADRVLSRGGREPYSELFLTKMASAINKVKKASPDGRFLTVDATNDSDTVASAVRNLIRERIPR